MIYIYYYKIYFKFIIIVLFILIGVFSFKIFSFHDDEIKKLIIQFNQKYKSKSITKNNNEKKFKQIKLYINLLKNGHFKSNVYYKKILKPKISIITTVFNKEKYLNTFIYSIQNQNLKEFELIIVDDSSNDKSVEIINKFKRKDKRIKLLRNKKNMHSLFSRYKGAIYSKGNYIYFVDADDIILKEGLLNAYNHIKKNDLDIIQFNSILEKNNKIWIERSCYKYKSIIYQPVLSYIYYYNNNISIEINRYLWDKLFRNKIVFKSFNYIGIKFLRKKIIIENDVVLLFSIFKNSKSFQYIDIIGYYSNRNNTGSVFNSRNDLKKSNQIIYSIFSNIEFLYDKSGKSNLSKYFCIFKLIQGYNRYINCFKFLNNNTLIKIHFIIDKLLNSNYISLNHKILIKNISHNILLTHPTILS